MEKQARTLGNAYLGLGDFLQHLVESGGVVAHQVVLAVVTLGLGPLLHDVEGNTPQAISQVGWGHGGVKEAQGQDTTQHRGTKQDAYLLASLGLGGALGGQSLLLLGLLLLLRGHSSHKLVHNVGKH